MLRMLMLTASLMLAGCASTGQVAGQIGLALIEHRSEPRPIYVQPTIVVERRGDRGRHRGWDRSRWR
jgi:hypothetical protein